MSSSISSKSSLSSSTQCGFPLAVKTSLFRLYLSLLSLRFPAFADFFSSFAACSCPSPLSHTSSLQPGITKSDSTSSFSLGPLQQKRGFQKHHRVSLTLLLEPLCTRD